MGTHFDNLAVNAHSTIFPLTRMGLYLSAGVIAGKKVVQGTAAGFFALSAKVADRLAIDREIIDEGSWRQWFHVNRDRFIDQTKQNAHRDLSIAGILASGGLVLEHFESTLNLRFENQKADNTWFSNSVTGDYPAFADKFKHLTFRTPKEPDTFMSKLRRWRITPLRHTNNSYCGPKCQQELARRKEILQRLFSPVAFGWSKTQEYGGKFLHKTGLWGTKAYGYGKGWTVWGTDGIAKGWSKIEHWPVINYLPGCYSATKGTAKNWFRQAGSGIGKVSSPVVSGGINITVNSGSYVWNKGGAFFSATGEYITTWGSQGIDTSCSLLGKLSDISWELTEKVANKIEVKY